MYTTKQYYHKLTDYPKIYELTYWGNFRYNENDDLKEIIQNRNNFIKDFNIKNHLKSVPKYMLARCEKHINIGDHIEKYKTNDNKLVILNSPYYLSEKEKQIFKDLEYVEVKPMYNKHAITYMFITDIDACKKKYNVQKLTDKKKKPIIVSFDL